MQYIQKRTVFGQGGSKSSSKFKFKSSRGVRSSERMRNENEHGMYVIVIVNE